MDHNDWSPLSTWKKGRISHLNSWYSLFFFFLFFGSEWAVGRLSCDLPVAGDAYRSTSMLHEAKQKFTSQAKERSKGNKEKKHTTTKRRRRWPPNRSSRPSFESSCTLRTSLHVQNPHLLLLLLNPKKIKKLFERLCCREVDVKSKNPKSMNHPAQIQWIDGVGPPN